MLCISFPIRYIFFLGLILSMIFPECVLSNEVLDHLSLSVAVSGHHSPAQTFISKYKTNYFLKQEKKKK